MTAGPSSTDRTAQASRVRRFYTREMTRLLAAALSLLLALQAPVAAAERAPAPSLRPVSVETPLSTPFASATTPSAETGAAIAA